jgi:hypothetical protein
MSDPQRLDFLRGAIKGPPRLSSTVDHSFHIANSFSMKRSWFQDLSHGDLSSTPWKSWFHMKIWYSHSW